MRCQKTIPARLLNFSKQINRTKHPDDDVHRDDLQFLRLNPASPPLAPATTAGKSHDHASHKVQEKVITKKVFSERLAARTGLDPLVVKKVFLETLDLIVEEVQAGNKLEFRGVFVLGSKVQRAREAQNPKTLEKVWIPERRVVYFRRGERLEGSAVPKQGKAVSVVLQREP